METKMHLKITVAGLFLLSIILTGCTHLEKPAETSSNTQTLLETEWILESFGAVGSEEPVGSNIKITLAFDEDGRLRGSAGCNRYFSGYELPGGNSLSLSTEHIGSTMMMCPDEIMTWENRYLKTLGTVSTYRIENDHLLLFADGEEQALSFRSEAHFEAESPH